MPHCARKKRKKIVSICTHSTGLAIQGGTTKCQVVYTYVKSGKSTKQVDLHKQGINVFLEVDFNGCWGVGDGVVSVGSDVLLDELSPLGFGGHTGMVAVVTCPFGEVVRNIKGSGPGRGVLVVDEAHGLLFGVGVNVHNHVAT